MQKKWQLKQIEESLIPKLPEYPALILRLLANRGMTEPREIKNFFNPDYANLSDPFLFSDMKKAVARIQGAVEKQEPICIYADYDADAITACAVVYLGLKKLGVRANYYIPDRFSEGYGLNIEAIKKLASEGNKLIITVDCGTNAVEEARLAQELGVDMIITDHHEITDGLPEALALLNPKNRQDNYPFPYLTGAGVAYKLVQALFRNLNSSTSNPPHSPLVPRGDETAEEPPLRVRGGEGELLTKGVLVGWEKWLLDLVAIGTVADLQPLTSENRLLVHFGLQVLNKTRWLGLQALIQVAGLDAQSRPFDTYTLGFLLAPRINAAGRIKHGNLAFQLLVAEDDNEAKQLAKELDELNSHRQTLTQQILSEAKSQVETKLDKKILLVASDNWPKGVVGLVAGKLTEEYNRPSLVIEKDGEKATGSARSVNDYDMVQALNYCQNLLQKYGGHAQAAGFALESKNIEAFYQKLLEYAEVAGYTPEPYEINIDSEVAAQDLTWDIYGYLAKFGPFGVGNPKPRFLAKNFKLLEARQVGSDNQHLKLRCSLDGQEFNAIAFGKGFLTDILNSNKTFDAVFELESNEWNGHKELQLKIIDLNATQ
ncbi:MAG: single-stranded-DNA-specific exonuclease RecJ [Candidatus Doudnabacteria bacterium]|nr:single-stranded-DNA-specific exonuclease RecJ [Candidatus Doudnabacteria bacterium]